MNHPNFVCRNDLIEWIIMIESLFVV